MLGAEPTKRSKLDAKSKLKRIKSCGEDLRTLATIWSFALLRKASSKSHAERLEQFYSAQAASYDNFRKNFLHGRRPLLASCAARIAAAGGPRPGAVWCDIGGGTGNQSSSPDGAPGICSQPDLVLSMGKCYSWSALHLKVGQGSNVINQPHWALKQCRGCIAGGGC